MSIRSSSRPVSSVVVAIGLIVGVSLASGPAPATLRSPHLAAARTYTVNSTADRVDADVGTARCADSHGKCTLRAAIMQANFHAGADTIKVPAGTYRLTRKGNDDVDVLGDLDITDSVTIKGAGSSKTIVDGNGSVTLDRVFQVLPAAAATTFSGLTIRHGRKDAGAFDEGGGLDWDGGGNGGLTLHDVIVEKNRASYGGGLFLRSGAGDAVDLNKLTVRGNVASAAAGGLGVVLTQARGFVLRNSHVSSNKAYEAGGLYLSGDADTAGSVRVTGTDIGSNHATLSGGMEDWFGTTLIPAVVSHVDLHDNTADAFGGAIGNHGVLDVSGTTLATNHAGTSGGALYGYAGSTTTLTNVTVSANTATDFGGGVYLAVFTTSFATVNMTNVTLSGNSAATAGGIYADAGAQAFVNDTLIAKGPSGANCSPSVGGSWNLSDDASCGFGTGDGIADLRLGPLGLHGGLTRTQLPKAGSPALDAGSSSGTPPTDQRGIPRPQGTAVDVGAVERCQTAPSAPSLLSPKNKATVKPRKVILDWNDVPCVQSYIVVVRHGSKTGSIVQIARDLRASTFTTKTLHRGWTYYWEVKAVGDSGKTTSAWRHST